MLVAALLCTAALAADTAYFQQRVHYRIEARLDGASETLSGRLRLRYHNRSNARLDTLWFHLHLNAFRPNSRWAQRELEYGERRFTDLGPCDHAFERVRRITVGSAVELGLLTGDAPPRSKRVRWRAEDVHHFAWTTSYAENRLQHVTEADLRAAVNAHSAAPLDWFFEQWIHTTNTLDYRIGEVTTAQVAGGRWQTTVEVLRDGEIWMPVELSVDGVTQRLESRQRRQVVTVTSSARPAEAGLDPQRILLDIDSANNRKRMPQ